MKCRPFYLLREFTAIVIAAVSQMKTFTFTHLADTFIQSDLHCIQVAFFFFESNP